MVSAQVPTPAAAPTSNTTLPPINKRRRVKLLPLFGKGVVISGVVYMGVAVSVRGNPG